MRGWWSAGAQDTAERSKGMRACACSLQGCPGAILLPQPAWGPWDTKGIIGKVAVAFRAKLSCCKCPDRLARTRPRYSQCPRVQR